MKRLVLPLLLVPFSACPMKESDTCSFFHKAILTSQSADRLQRHHEKCWNKKRDFVQELLNRSFSANDCTATVDEESVEESENEGERVS